MVAIAVFTGFVSGSSNAALIALISRAVSQDSTLSITNLFWSFLGLALVALITSIILK
jgi:putative ATP-binding cassette transporter